MSGIKDIAFKLIEFLTNEERIPYVIGSSVTLVLLSFQSTLFQKTSKLKKKHKQLSKDYEELTRRVNEFEKTIKLEVARIDARQRGKEIFILENGETKKAKTTKDEE